MRITDKDLKIASFIMFSVYVVADLLSTAINLWTGKFYETAPYAHIFGSGLIITIVWLAVMKIVFILVLESLAAHTQDAHRNLLIIYTVLTVMGLAMTYHNFTSLIGFMPNNLESLIP